MRLLKKLKDVAKKSRTRLDLCNNKSCCKFKRRREEANTTAKHSSRCNQEIGFPKCIMNEDAWTEESKAIDDKFYKVTEEGIGQSLGPRLSCISNILYLLPSIDI